MASPSTHSRLENRVDRKAIVAIHEIIIDTFLDSYDQPPQRRPIYECDVAFLP